MVQAGSSDVRPPAVSERSSPSCLNDARTDALTQAAFCYDKAGLFFEKSVAEAFEARRVLRASARKSTRANPSDTSLVAAKFRACAENAPNIEQGKKLYRPCADLYLAARRHEEAARAFELADEFDQSALVYLGMGKRFTDDAVRVARTGRTTAATRDKVFKTARFGFLHPILVFLPLHSHLQAPLPQAPAARPCPSSLRGR